MRPSVPTIDLTLPVKARSFAVESSLGDVSGDASDRNCLVGPVQSMPPE